ncbi:MAG: hypothetical protein V4632_09020 [Pseudomonadota bacterium]
MRKLINIIGFISFSGLAGAAAAAELSGFTNQQSVTGLKDALSQGAANAVANPGRPERPPPAGLLRATTCGSKIM